jgi:hypothetical protein
LFGSNVTQAVECQVDTFSDADACDASQQKSIGVQTVCTVEFLLQSPVVFRRQGSWEILRTCRKIFANNQTGLEEMALEGQIIEKSAKAKQVLLSGVVAQRRILFAEPTEPPQNVGIATEL